MSASANIVLQCCHFIGSFNLMSTLPFKILCMSTFYLPHFAMKLQAIVNKPFGV